MIVHTPSTLINRFMYRSPETLLSFDCLYACQLQFVVRVFGVSRNKENVREYEILLTILYSGMLGCVVW